MGKKMKVTSLQLPVIAGNKEASLESTFQELVATKHSDLIILPELWNIGFMDFDSYISSAEKEDGPTLSMVRDAACKTSSYIHSGSFVEEDGGQYYNTSFLIDPDGKLIGKYRKIHLFGYGSKESLLLSSGNEPRVVATDIGTLGLATCFDLRFPELFRDMVDKGAEIFLVTSAWPLARVEHWRLFNQARAVENQAYLISANSAGISCGCQFAGNSMVVHPDGTVIEEADKNAGKLSCEVYLEDVAKYRKTFPALASRTTWL